MDKGTNEATKAIITNKRLDSVHPTTGRGVYTCTVECSGCGHSRRYGFAGWCGLICGGCGAEMERQTPAEQKAQEAEAEANEIRKNAGMVGGAMEAAKEALEQMQRDCDNLREESDSMRNQWAWGTPERKAWKRRAFVARKIKEKLEEVIELIWDDWEGVEHDWARLPSAPENRREAHIEAMKAEEAAELEEAAPEAEEAQKAPEAEDAPEAEEAQKAPRKARRLTRLGVARLFPRSEFEREGSQAGKVRGARWSVPGYSVGTAFFEGKQAVSISLSKGGGMIAPLEPALLDSGAIDHLQRVCDERGWTLVRPEGDRLCALITSEARADSAPPRVRVSKSQARHDQALALKSRVKDAEAGHTCEMCDRDSTSVLMGRHLCGWHLKMTIMKVSNM